MKKYASKISYLFRIIFVIFTTFSFSFASTSPLFARMIQTNDISVPSDFKIEAAVKDLASPTMVIFDDQGRMLIAESGYSTGEVPKISRIESNGSKTVLTKDNAFGAEIPLTSISFYQGKIYAVHAGTVSILQDDGTLQDIITGLPGQGDHQANTIVFYQGKMYLSIGTVTNSAVVGEDNAVFGWLKKPALRDLHDVPCQDITLTNNATFETTNALNPPSGKVKTSAYSSYDTSLPGGSKITGNVKCNGAILTANPDGTNLQVYAWGLRNPYGLAVGPDGALYTSMHGFDARGSRQIENAWDCFYKVQQSAWYGWPDFACDVPVTDSQFKAANQPQPQFLIANHPTEKPPTPLVKFNPHSAANGFTFDLNSNWGNSGDVYLAEFGDFTPATGTVSIPQGVKVVKFSPTTGQVTDFIANKIPGQASRNNAGGLEHPSSVTFGPDGNMYIADWGVAGVSENGVKLESNSGVIWKVSKINAAGQSTNGNGTATNPEPFNSTALFVNAIITIVLGIATYLIIRGVTVSPYTWQSGATSGAIAALITAVFAFLISKFAMDLPWYAPGNVFATLLMGSTALVDILNFHFGPFILGIIVMLIVFTILGALFTLLVRTDDSTRVIVGAILFSLTAWAVLQYFVFPIIAPLITQKGFTPFWYAVTFAIFGTALGFLLRRDKEEIVEQKVKRPKPTMV